METDWDDPPFPGVRALDHTADVGIEVSAADLPELLCRSAQGLTWLLLEREPCGPSEERPLRLAADGPASLLRGVLRELLWWHESEGLATQGFRNTRVEASPGGLELITSVQLVRDDRSPVREIKGVTLHELTAEPRDGGWYARVIFDV